MANVLDLYNRFKGGGAGGKMVYPLENQSDYLGKITFTPIQEVITDITEEDNDVGEGTCDEQENNVRHEMKGPSLFNNDDISKMLNPEMMKKMQKNPKFLEMMKTQEEENKIKNMDPREKLRARLRQKRNNRMSARTKEAQVQSEEDSPTKEKRKKKIKKPES